MAGTPSGGTPTGGDASWFQATARQRIAGFLDAGSFHEFLPPTERVQSPHLAQFDLPAAFDDGVIVGRGKLDGQDILLAAQEGQFMGGTFAEVSGAKLVGLFRAARDHEQLPRKIVLLMDSGGVRLQEANAGELAVAEVMRAIVEARSAGVTVVALVGGKAGAFGGAGLTAATCSRIVISEEGRTGVTGPEVIETNKGVEEFDSADKALVWATMGGKTRRLIGGADLYTKDTMAGFREAAIAALKHAPVFDLATMQAEQKRLKKRLKHFGDCDEASDIWKELGIKDTAAVRDMGDEAFLKLAENTREATMKLDDVLKGLFGKHHDIEHDGDVLTGSAKLEGGGAIAVIGAVGGAPLSPDGALQLAKHVLKVVEEGGETPILVLVDTEGQLMARRAEMLGLNEYLAHLAKCLLLASREGHRTIGLEYGKAAAGAFLATALATDVLVALPGAEPAVMDLPSIARVTKLDLDKLKEMAKSTPVFAPGLDHLSQTGAVKNVWDSDKPLAPQLAATLRDASPLDRRDALGKEREGRPMAADVAKRVIAAAIA